MRISMPGLLALEVAFREEEKKNDQGEYVPTGKRIPHIVAFPFGQSIKFGSPSTVCMRIPEGEVGKAESARGKFITLTADQRVGKTGNYYVFEGMEIEK